MCIITVKPQYAKIIWIKGFLEPAGGIKLNFITLQKIQYINKISNFPTEFVLNDLTLYKAIIFHQAKHLNTLVFHNNIVTHYLELMTKQIGTAIIL
jgi:hypothetical protein